MTMAPTIPSPAVCGPSGQTIAAQAFLLSLAVRDDEQRSQRIEALVRELDAIHLDRSYAAQMRPETTGPWLRELAAEERRVWRELRPPRTDQDQEV